MRLTVRVFTVLSDIRVDGNGVAGFGTEVVEKLCFAWVAIGVFAEGVYDPNLSAWVMLGLSNFSYRPPKLTNLPKVNCGRDCGAFLVARDKFHILNTTTIWDRNGVGDGAVR